MKASIGIVLTVLASIAGAEGLLDEALSDAYEEAPIPDEWIPRIRAEPIASAFEYPRASVRSVEIAKFVKVYGVPTRLLTRRDRGGYSYLVYDLADGYKLLVHVPSISGSRLMGAQLFAPDGKTEGPLLK